MIAGPWNYLVSPSHVSSAIAAHRSSRIFQGLAAETGIQNDGSTSGLDRNARAICAPRSQAASAGGARDPRTRSSTSSRASAAISAGNLGVVELTLALHYVFNTPRDQIVFDNGHQTYPHKLLTAGRPRSPPSASQTAFPVSASGSSRVRRLQRRHASTSISAALASPSRAITVRRTTARCVIGDVRFGRARVRGPDQAGHLKSRLMSS